MSSPSYHSANILGQTLIETMAALFILVMGISAASGLAVYAFNSSRGVIKQVIATGLAREGIEAVRDMRDTNWLNNTDDPLGIPANSTGCYDFVTMQPNAANCYKNWLGKSASSLYCINPSNNSCDGALTTASYFLGFDASKNDFIWVLKQDNSKFGLDFNTSPDNYGFYSPGSSNIGVTCANATSDYCRKITITKDTSNANYQQDTGPLLKVQSQVWWVDKKCPRVADYSSAPVACRVELDSFLTNWKTD